MTHDGQSTRFEALLQLLSEISDDWETGKTYLAMSTHATARGTQRKASGVPRGRQ